MSLKGKNVLIVGESEVSCYFTLTLLQDKAKAVDNFHIPNGSFDKIVELANLHLSESVDVLLIFPFLWEILYEPNNDVFDIGFLRYFEAKVIIDKVKNISSVWTSKFPNLEVLWMIPFTPNFLEYIGYKKTKKPDFWVRKNLKFYDTIKDLCTIWDNSIPYIKYFDLHECYLLQGRVCLDSFQNHSVHPANMTFNGFGPTNDFNVNLCNLLPKKLGYPQIEDSENSEKEKNIYEEDEYMNQSHHFSASKEYGSNQDSQFSGNFEYECYNNSFPVANHGSSSYFNKEQDSFTYPMEDQNSFTGTCPPSNSTSNHFIADTNFAEPVNGNYQTQISRPISNSYNDFDKKNDLNALPLSSHMLNSIKSALNIISYETNKEDNFADSNPLPISSFSDYEDYFKSFMLPSDWQDLFLKGDGSLAIDCLKYCIMALRKWPVRKGVRMIFVSSSFDVLERAEKEAKQVIMSNELAINDENSFGLPVILMDTPLAICQRIDADLSYTLTNLVAIFICGDDLFDVESEVHSDFEYFANFILDRRKACLINKVLVTESGSSEVKDIANKMFEGPFISPVVEEEEGLNTVPENDYGFTDDKREGDEEKPSILGYLLEECVTTQVDTTPTTSVSDDRDRSSRSKSRSDYSRHERRRSHYREENRRSHHKEEKPRKHRKVEESREEKVTKIISFAKILPTPEQKEEFSKCDKEFAEFLEVVVGSHIENEYMNEGRKRFRDHESDFKFFLESPEMHPRYEEMYEIYVNKYEEVFEDLKDTEFHQATWEKFWKVAISYMKDFYWNETKIIIQQEYMKKYEERRAKIMEERELKNARNKKLKNKVNGTAEIFKKALTGAKDNKKSEAKKEEKIPAKPRTKIAFNLKPRQEFSLSEVLNQLESVTSSLANFGPALDSLISQSRVLMETSELEALLVFNEKDNSFLLNMIVTKINDLLEDCPLTEQRHFRLVLTSIESLTKEAKSSAGKEKIRSDSLDLSSTVEALAKQTFGMDTENTYKIIVHVFSDKKRKKPDPEEIDEIFKKVSEKHFEMAMDI